MVVRYQLTNKFKMIRRKMNYSVIIFTQENIVFKKWGKGNKAWQGSSKKSFDIGQYGEKRSTTSAGYGHELTEQGDII